MDKRKYSTPSYRYAFNGKENVEEWGVQDYGFRDYNPLTCRFMSVDPSKKDYPYLTPYQFASNSPISGIDLDGLEYYYAADGKFLGQGGDPKNKEVRLGKITGKTESGILRASAQVLFEKLGRWPSIKEYRGFSSS